MFPNCIDPFGRQKKKETTQQKNKQRKSKKINNKKMGIIVPNMNHYARHG